MILFCGNCQRKYEIKGMFGQPDLEGIIFDIGGQKIPGTEINICYKCAIDALAGHGNFRRNGNIVTLKINHKLTKKGRK